MVEKIKRTPVLVQRLKALKEVNVEFLVVDSRTVVTDHPLAMVKLMGGSGGWGRCRGGWACCWCWGLVVWGWGWHWARAGAGPLPALRLPRLLGREEASGAAAACPAPPPAAGCYTGHRRRRGLHSPPACLTPARLPFPPPPGEKADANKLEAEREIDQMVLRLASLMTTLGDYPSLRWGGRRGPGRAWG